MQFRLLHAHSKKISRIWILPRISLCTHSTSTHSHKSFFQNNTKNKKEDSVDKSIIEFPYIVIHVMSIVKALYFTLKTYNNGLCKGYKQHTFPKYPLILSVFVECIQIEKLEMTFRLCFLVLRSIQITFLFQPPFRQVTLVSLFNRQHLISVLLYTCTSLLRDFYYSDRHLFLQILEVQALCKGNANRFLNHPTQETHRI